MRYAYLVAILLVAGGAAQADTIRQACLTADRSAHPALCACIQDAANRTLSARDQKVAARFFSDPDEAEAMRMSKRRSHEAFWDRYQAFGDFARSLCS